MIGVYNTEGTDHTPADYEDIDNAKPIVPPPDIMFANSMHDYSRSSHPFEMINYEVPMPDTMSKVCALHKLFSIFDTKNVDPVLIRKAQIF